MPEVYRSRYAPPDFAQTNALEMQRQMFDAGQQHDFLKGKYSVQNPDGTIGYRDMAADEGARQFDQSMAEQMRQFNARQQGEQALQGQKLGSDWNLANLKINSDQDLLRQKGIMDAATGAMANPQASLGDAVRAAGNLANVMKSVKQFSGPLPGGAAPPTASDLRVYGSGQQPAAQPQAAPATPATTAATPAVTTPTGRGYNSIEDAANAADLMNADKESIARILAGKKSPDATLTKQTLDPGEFLDRIAQERQLLQAKGVQAPNFMSDLMREGMQKYPGFNADNFSRILNSTLETSGNQEVTSPAGVTHTYNPKWWQRMLGGGQLSGPGNIYGTFSNALNHEDFQAKNNARIQNLLEVLDTLQKFNAQPGQR